ncbi:MAG: glycoside hydrolase family 15 protein [Chloroflexia bacterium]|nr:glycoside hydrolase family 15 protein [Chloroflexia bacterium]
MTDPAGPSFVPYPPIGRHGVVGDRRTAALVAADGTVDWLCLPIYDGPPVCGALLDPENGGYWRIGPASPALGRQRYLDESAVLVTTWTTAAGELELTDAMAWPWDDRDAAHGGPDGRVLIRRLRCRHGEAAAVADLRPRHDFGAAGGIARTNDGVVLDVGGRALTFWTSRLAQAAIGTAGVSLALELAEGDEVWSVLAFGEEERRPWTAARAAAALAETERFWHDWTGSLDLTGAGPRRDRVRRSATTIHLLSYAPTGSPVAAPTTSLPERRGGDRNWDYRYAWVRDAALSVTTLSRLGDLDSGRRYLDCLATYRSSTDSPLQVVYRIDGGLDLPERERADVAGYAGSRPVRVGNRACGQRQLDSLGFFADCALVYLDQGGEWTDDHWAMVRRAADYTAATWRLPDSGIWEETAERHFVSSKVMSWVALDRAATIAARTGRGGETDGWRREAAAIHAEVMERGWSERLGAFRRHYDDDGLDASVLLIPLVGFLPVDHPRVAATIDRIVEELTIDGFVHRYLPPPGEPPLGVFEGAFLPCTFWLATVRAMAGQAAEAEAILAAAEAVAGDLGLFAEEVDVRTRTFLGNTPLLFAQAEYVRAALALAGAGT